MALSCQSLIFKKKLETNRPEPPKLGFHNFFLSFFVHFKTWHQVEDITMAYFNIGKLMTPREAEQFQGQVYFHPRCCPIKKIMLFPDEDRSLQHHEKMIVRFNKVCAFFLNRC